MLIQHKIGSTASKMGRLGVKWITLSVGPRNDKSTVKGGGGGSLSGSSNRKKY